MAKIIIGIVGLGEDATEKDRRLAYELGRLVALKGWALLTGGRPHGVMHAASEGAKVAGGLTLGILPSAERVGISTAIDIPILTGFGEARNVVNVLTSQVVLVCGMSAGTASEVALALKARRPVILVDAEPATVSFFASFGRPIIEAEDPAGAIRIVEQLLQQA
jgi:uncharacterized protein (TIGR00725 family)